MNDKGRLIRIIAIIALILVLAVAVTSYVMNAMEMSESLKEFKEDKRAHQDTHDSASERKNCSTCDNYKERQKDYDRATISYIISALTTFLFMAVPCGILYAAGAILGNMSAAPAYAMSAAPVKEEPFIKPAVVKCPRCGAHQKSGDRFCPVCGSSFEG